MGCGWHLDILESLRLRECSSWVWIRPFQVTRPFNFRLTVKALGLMPGDLITVTYPKENLRRTPFRITGITPGASYRTAAITAQLHDDDWYSDAPTGITGGLGKQTGQGAGLPAPVAGTVIDANGSLQLGMTESEVDANGSGAVDVELDVSFTAPSGKIGTLPAPLIGLAPVVSASGGTLGRGLNYFYAVSAVDSTGGESSLSFYRVHRPRRRPAMLRIPFLSMASFCRLEARGFHVYRGIEHTAL